MNVYHLGSVKNPSGQFWNSSYFYYSHVSVNVIFTLHPAGQIEHFGGPVLAHVPYV